MEEVRIEWYGPYKIDSVQERFHEYEDFGVYMITRKWGEGPEKILYVGLTYRQDLGTRLSQHQWLPTTRGNVRVRIGYLIERRPSGKRLKDVENLLICSCWWDADTTYNKRDYLYGGRDLRILNFGRRGPLDRTIDSAELEPWQYA
jgi:hypothetical protein